MEEHRCLECNKEIFFNKKSARFNKFCSTNCYHLNTKGKPLTGERLKQQRERALKAVESRKKNPDVRRKWIEKMKEVTTGNNNHRWVHDRSKLVNQEERNSYKYLTWSKSVLVRDNYKCRIQNNECKGRLEVHHILSWKEYPELRFNNNNGITLCHAHHPRVKSEEKRLIPTFQELVSVSKL